MFRATLAALEGWGRPTIPSRELLDYLSVNSVDEAIGVVYSAENPKALIAGFAPRVVEAARRGGVVALEILEDVAEAITSMLEAAARLSSCRRFCIVGDTLDPMLSKRGYSVEKRKFDMEWAAVLLALRDYASRRPPHSPQ